MQNQCELIFNVKELLKMTIKNFNELWPQVSNIWAIKRTGEPQDGEPWKVYNCRLLKRIKSSIRKDEVPENKHHKTNIRDSGQCFSEIKITFGNQIVQIERHGNKSEHTHTLSESDMVKRPESIRNLIVSEASKPYHSLDITHVVKDLAIRTLGEESGVQYLNRKEVTNIQTKIQEPITAHLLGSENFVSDIQQAIEYLKSQHYSIQQFYLTTSASERGFSIAKSEQVEKLTKYD